MSDAADAATAMWRTAYLRQVKNLNKLREHLRERGHLATCIRYHDRAKRNDCDCGIRELLTPVRPDGDFAQSEDFAEDNADFVTGQA